MSRSTRTKRIPTHPGEVLLEEFLAPLEITQVELAAHIGVPVQRINEIVRGKHGVNANAGFACSSLIHDRIRDCSSGWRRLLAAADIFWRCVGMRRLT